MEILPAVLALAGFASVTDAVLQLFFGGPFLDVFKEILSFFGLSGKPRNAATEQTGLLLSASTNNRIAQLGRAIYWAARAHGRVLSSRRDEKQFFAPAVLATAENLGLNPQQVDWLVLSVQRRNKAALVALDRTLPQDRDSITLAWLISELEKLGCVVLAEDPEAMIGCIVALKVKSWIKTMLIGMVRKFFGGKTVPATCSSTHVESVHKGGPGVCCASMPAGVRAHPAVGERWAAKDKRGKCFVCEIAHSTAKNAAPGQLKIVRGKAGQLCPTSTHGCCFLLA